MTKQSKDKMITEAKDILILSGDCASEVGTWRRYTGKRTARAVAAHLTRQRARGDRWASAWAYAWDAWHPSYNGASVYSCIDDPCSMTIIYGDEVAK